MAFYSGQLKAHLCNNHAASSNAKPARWLVYPSREVLTKTDVDKFVINIWEKSTFCIHWKFYICGSWKIGANTWQDMVSLDGGEKWLAHAPCSPDIIQIISWKCELHIPYLWGTLKTYIRADINGVHLESIRHRDTHQTSARMRSCITSGDKSTAASQSDKITAAIITAIKTCGLHADNEVLVLEQRQWNSKFCSLGVGCVYGVRQLDLKTNKQI